MAASSVKINPSMLQILVNALTKLQSRDGMAHDDAIWSFANVNMELMNLTTETCHLFRPALLNVKDVLKQLEEVGYALKELTASCERKLKALRRTLQPSSLLYGIQMLPDDVLMHVFDIIMEQPDHNSEEVFRLSHVSSRFRSLTLARPQLWSRTSSDMPANVVKTCLKHSKEALLTVNISVLRRIKNPNEFLRLVVRHSSRWKAFSFGCRQTSPGTERPLQLSQSTGNCNLSNLEVLQLSCCGRGSCGLCRIMDVLQTQEMPKLHFLRIKYISLSPTWLLRPPASIRIRCLSLFMPDEWDIPTLANVLTPLVDLVELRLNAFRSHSVNNGVIQDTDLALPNPKLKCLYLDGFDLVSFSVWTRWCRTPRVEELGLSMQRLEPDEEWLTAIPSGSFGSVKKLYFGHNFLSDRRNDCVVDFWQLVSKFPSLEHVDISARSCYFNSDLRHELSTNMPPLRSLSLRLALPSADLSYFVDTLQDSGRWERFKSFGSKRLGWDTEQTEKLLEGKEVKWYR